MLAKSTATHTILHLTMNSATHDFLFLQHDIHANHRLHLVSDGGHLLLVARWRLQLRVESRDTKQSTTRVKEANYPQPFAGYAAHVRTEHRTWPHAADFKHE